MCIYLCLCVLCTVHLDVAYVIPFFSLLCVCLSLLSFSFSFSPPFSCCHRRSSCLLLSLFLALAINSLNGIVCHLLAKCELIYSITLKVLSLCSVVCRFKMVHMNAGEWALNVIEKWHRIHVCFFFSQFLLAVLYPSNNHKMEYVMLRLLSKTNMNFISLQK